MFRPTRSKRLPWSSLAAATLPLVLAAAPAAAQSAASAPAHPGMMGHPSLPPGPLGANMGSGDYLVTSSANEHGSFLWIVDAVQRTVMLCEKTDATKEFGCSKRPLP